MRKSISLMLDGETILLSDGFKVILSQLQSQLNALDECIQIYDKTITVSTRNNPICQRLQTIPGFGPMISSAYFNEVGTCAGYRRGRDVSASIGIVPRQHSSGGKDTLLGI